MQNILEGNKEYYGSWEKGPLNDKNLVLLTKFINVNGTSIIAERFKSGIWGFYFSEICLRFCKTCEHGRWQTLNPACFKKCLSFPTTWLYRASDQPTWNKHGKLRVTGRFDTSLFGWGVNSFTFLAQRTKNIHPKYFFCSRPDYSWNERNFCAVKQLEFESKWPVSKVIL